MTLNSPATTSEAAKVGSDSPKVAIAHDWLVRYAGSERRVNEFGQSVDDDELRSLYRPSRAMVYTVNEDFAIVMAEAPACGTPMIWIGGGGERLSSAAYRDTVRAAVSEMIHDPRPV